LVTWDALTFDLTNSANTPFITAPAPACLGGLTHGAASFAVLSGACTPPIAGGRTLWSADTQDRFFFFTTDSTNTVTLAFAGTSPHPNPTVNTQGSWSITAAPEPSSGLLIASALLAVALLARKGLARRLRFVASITEDT
jgi:hypothetical protein